MDRLGGWRGGHVLGVGPDIRLGPPPSQPPVTDTYGDHQIDVGNWDSGILGRVLEKRVSQLSPPVPKGALSITENQYRVG